MALSCSCVDTCNVFVFWVVLFQIGINIDVLFFIYSLSKTGKYGFFSGYF